MPRNARTFAVAVVIAAALVGCQGSRETDLERAMRENDAQGSAVQQHATSIARSDATAAPAIR